MGRKTVRDERRKQILDAVHQCLLEKPFHKTSIKDIARKAGLNHGALHYYFENKEHILLEYIDYSQKKFDIFYDKFLKEENVRSAADLDSINEKCHWALDELTFHKEYARIFIEIWAHALYNPNVMKKIKGMYRERRDTLFSDISNIVDSKKEARKISLTVIAVFEGLSLMSSLFSKKDLQYDFDFNDFLKLLNTK
ncbi:MAG: TetR/AcrR family transcriptional regulator [Deltaproteobacteria bacterium]|nr:TetR/AcrR family transcriptional regulator [Deltaproteobacteria bacterium]